MQESLLGCLAGQRQGTIVGLDRFRGATQPAEQVNIGLVELPEGVTLIRIGRPLWPEFAAWRYGRRFSRRRVKTGLAAGTIITGALGAAAGAVAAGFGGIAFVAAYAAGLWIMDEGPKRRPVAAFNYRDRFYYLTQDDAEATRVFEDGRSSFGLAFHHAGGVQLLRGPDVLRVLGRVIPSLSPFGGNRQEVVGAIEVIDRAGSANVCINETLTRATRQAGFLTELPVETRLALEMSLQEQGERTALDGEMTVRTMESRIALIARSNTSSASIARSRYGSSRRGSPDCLMIASAIALPSSGPAFSTPASSGPNSGA